ncbi:MAG: hypothetical protein J6S49_09175 [Erysipelotrichaceae bacterium]|nr:hypothetical protein [Erysipelotrichaceae bacterium]
MKKLLLVIMCIAMCACSKAVTWEDVSEKFAQAQETAGNPYRDSEVFLAADYRKMINTVKDGIDSLENADEEKLLKIYKDVSVLENCVSDFDDEEAVYLKQLSAQIKEYVRSFYDKTLNQETLKEEIDQRFETVLSWSDEKWLCIEKRKLISWNEVEEEYETLRKEALDNMTDRKQVTEIELQQLSDTIVAYHELIKDGINDANREKADEMYKAAVILKEYTGKIKNSSCEKVAALADDTITYITGLYGGEIEDEDYDFEGRVQSAAKWSLSLWNEVTTQLKR